MQERLQDFFDSIALHINNNKTKPIKYIIKTIASFQTPDTKTKLINLIHFIKLNRKTDNNVAFIVSSDLKIFVENIEIVIISYKAKLMAKFVGADHLEFNNFSISFGTDSIFIINNDVNLIDQFDRKNKCTLS